MNSFEAEFPERWVEFDRYVEVADRLATRTREMIIICEFCFERNLKYLDELEKNHSAGNRLSAFEALGIPVPPVPPDNALETASFGVPAAYLRVLFGPGGFKEHLTKLRLRELDELGNSRSNDLYEYIKENRKDCFQEIGLRLLSEQIVWKKVKGKFFLDFQVTTPVIAAFFKHYRVTGWTRVAKGVYSMNIPVSSQNLKGSKTTEIEARGYFFEDV